ncbi:MAG: metal-dependent transcriptional regulator [Clostridia bacterium]|nr:metal-dependent transcriptional regulator [Clostridia bacterium]
MHLQESGEMYLETIYVLSQEKPSVHSIDVSEHMGYSKPSVSRAIGLLKAGGYVEMSEDGSLTLTPSGVAVAEKIYERHTILTALLVKLGVDRDTAAEDACKMEHDISDASLNAIKAFVEIK